MISKFGFSLILDKVHNHTEKEMLLSLYHDEYTSLPSDIYIHYLSLSV